jgi:AcrR family transcriptional regulator
MDTHTNKKRAAILEAGLPLMLKHGIGRISVEEICREAGVSKMTFYKHFKNKTALAEAILQEQIKTLESRIEAIRASDLPYKEKIRAFVRLKLDQALPMSWAFYKDIQKSQNQDWLNSVVEWNKGILNLFLEDLKKKQASGEIRLNVSPETFLYCLERGIEWERDERFYSRFTSVEAMASEMLNLLFYGFIGGIEEKRP